MKGELSIKGRWELEDIIFTCGTDFRTPDLYTADLVCNSLIESTFFSSRPKEQYVFLHCGTPEYSKEHMNKKLDDFNSVFPVCIICKEAGRMIPRNSIFFMTLLKGIQTKTDFKHYITRFAKKTSALLPYLLV